VVLNTTNRFAPLVVMSDDDQEVPCPSGTFVPIDDEQLVPSAPVLETVDLTKEDDHEGSSLSSSESSPRLRTDERLEDLPPPKRRKVYDDEDDEDVVRGEGFDALADVLKFCRESRENTEVVTSNGRIVCMAFYFGRYHRADQIVKCGKMLKQLYMLPVRTEDHHRAEERLLEFLYDVVFDLQN
jgi:hypothetical protein